jgi:hypothetical protein
VQRKTRPGLARICDGSQIKSPHYPTPPSPPPSPVDASNTRIQSLLTPLITPHIWNRLSVSPSRGRGRCANNAAYKCSAGQAAKSSRRVQRVPNDEIKSMYSAEQCDAYELSTNSTSAIATGPCAGVVRQGTWNVSTLRPFGTSDWSVRKIEGQPYLLSNQQHYR